MILVKLPLDKGHYISDLSSHPKLIRNAFFMSLLEFDNDIQKI